MKKLKPLLLTRFRNIRFNLKSPYYLGNNLKISKNSSLKENIEIMDNVIILDNVRIGVGTSINTNTRIDSAVIGNYCSIGSDCHIGGGQHDITAMSTSQLLPQLSNKISHSNEHPWLQPPVIGHDVWLAAKVIVLQGVTIGNGAVIGAGSVVTKDIPPYAIAVGNPAKVIKYRFSSEKIAQLSELSWWDKKPDDIETIEK